MEVFLKQILIILYTHLNNIMKYTLILFFSLLLISGCTVYSEKNSEALSQSVYASKDSLDNERVDLAQQYVNQAVRIVVPPKKRIPINPIYSDDDAAVPVQVHSNNPHKTSRLSSSAKDKNNENVQPNRKKVVTLPESFAKDKIVFVNSSEYKKLLEDRKTAEQLKWDYYYLNEDKKQVDLQIVKDKDINNKMITDLNNYQKEVYKLRFELLWRDIIIGALSLLILGFIYLKVTKPIPFL